MAVYERVSIGSLAQGTVPPGYTFTRSTTALYVDSDGLLKSAAINTPRRQWDATNRRWGYVGEGSRTNLLLQSILPGGGATPTGWFTPAQDPTGPVASIYGSVDGASAYLFEPTANQCFLEQSVTVTSNTTYAFSVYVESTTGSPSIANLMCVVGEPAGFSGQYYIDGEVVPSYSVVTSPCRIHVVYSGTYVGEPVSFRIGCGVSSPVTGTAVLSRPQLEAGPTPSSYIPTTTVAVTRGADLLTRALTGPEGTALSTQGTMVVEFSLLGGDNTVSINSRAAIAIDDGTSSNRHNISNRTGGLGGQSVLAGSNVATPSVAGSYAVGAVQKIAYTWKSNDLQVSVNGSHGTRVTSSAATMPTVSAIGIASQSNGSLAGSVLVYAWTISDDHYPTDAGMDALTTPTTNRNQSRLTLGLGLGL